MKQILRELYTTNMYAAITKILDINQIINSTDYLVDSITTVIDENYYYNRINLSAIIDNLIVEYLIDHVILKEYGIILDRNSDISLYTMSSLMDFMHNMTMYDIELTKVSLDIMNNVDNMDELKLAMILNQYDDNVDIITTMNEFVNIPISLMDTIHLNLDNTFNIGISDHDNINDSIYRLMSVDNELSKSKFLSYVITNDAYDMTDSNCVNVIARNNPKPDDDDYMLGLDMVVYGVLFNKDNDYLINIIESAFVDFNTTSVAAYITKNIGVKYD